MDCPVCHQEMKKVREASSTSKDKEKTYDRTTYHCQEDDAWIMVEIPQRVAIAAV